MTIKELKKIAQKGSSEPYWISRYLFRKISIYVTYLFIKIGISATQTTIISAFFALAGSVFLAVDYQYRFQASSACLFLFYLLDHVDGEIARYQHASEPNEKTKNFDISGAYLDRIIHYFQGASFYFCLGVGLTFMLSNQLWFWLGLLAALGSCGFPRFVACFDILNVVERERSDDFFNYVERYSKFNVVHFSDDKELTQKFSLPQNISDFTLIGRQLLAFPGNLMLFILLTILYVIMGGNDIIIFNLYLGMYSVIFTVNTMYSMIKYFKILKGIPK